MTLKVGTLCFATDSGLGILAREFVRHGVVTDPMIVSHGRHVNHYNWHPTAPIIYDVRRDLQRMQEFCGGCDVMLFFETPFAWSLIDFCRKIGVKTVLSVMHECTPEQLPALPDLFLCPSELDYAVFREKYPAAKVVHIPVPVDVPWKLRTTVKTFVHVAGHGGLKGRNGTAELIEAWNYVRSPALLILRSQKEIDPRLTAYPRKGDYGNEGPSCVVKIGTVPHETLWSEGDALIFCEKWNGLSLPLQEARAAGMFVIATDRHPINLWLPKEGLVKPSGFVRSRIGPPYNEFDEAVLDPKAIAAMIDAWYGKDISEYSRQGKAWAEGMSWEVLGPKYREVLHGLVDG